MENDIVRMLFLRRQRQKKRWKIKTISGAPPLSFKAKAGVLKDYRIYGNTVDGESVGDRTGNLFDGIFLQGYYAGADGSYVANYTTWICTNKLPCKPNTTYTLSFNSVNSRWYGFFWFTENGDYILSDTVHSPQTQCHYTASSPSNAAYMAIDIAGYPDIEARIKPSDVTDLMLVEGSTPLPYEPYGYRVPVTVGNGTDTQTIPIYLPEQIRKIGDEAEYIDYGEQKQHRVRKNLLPNEATSQTINGVAFTVNNDRSVTCNGTVSKETPIGVNAPFIVPTITLPAGKYILSGCPAGGSENTTFKQLIYANKVWLINDKGSGANFILTDASEVSVRIVIYPGYTCDNLTFYPMIRKADITDDTYEPYIENTDLDVTLPELPTLAGTNVLTVGTEVQPSGVEITGRIKKGE